MDRYRSVRDWVRYRADNALSKGIGIVLLWVGLLLLLAIALVSFVIWLTDSGPNDQGTNFAEALWISLTRSLDPGTFGADEGFRFRLATLFVTLIGLLVLATLIGLVSNAIDRRIEELRRGKSLVLEHGHTLILGVSQKLPIVVKEIVEANLSLRRHSIVILTDEDKVLVEESLRQKIPDLGTTKLVVRMGAPSSIRDLERVNPSTAKVIIILAADDSRADAMTVRTALAVRQIQGADYERPVIIEVASEHTASALRQALPQNYMPIITNDIIAKVAAQTSRSAGLGTVYQELLAFAGNEFYFAAVPLNLVGEDFFTAAENVDKGVLTGVKSHNEAPVLAPDPGYVLTESDQLLVLAEDDSLIHISAAIRKPEHDGDKNRFVPKAATENLLVLGWNSTARWILQEIDRRVVAGSQLTVMAHPLVADKASEFLDTAQLNQQASLVIGDSTSYPEIYRVMEGKAFDHVLVLGSMRFNSRVESDASTLLTLMHVRSVLEQLNVPLEKVPNIVAELHEEDSVDLARVARPDDFIVSQRIVSLILAQLSENPQLFGAFNELLDPFGSEVIMVPARELLGEGEFTMREISRTVLSQGAIVLGWEQGRSVDGGLSTYSERIQLNPEKSATLKVDQWARLVVLTSGDKQGVRAE